MLKTIFEEELFLDTHVKWVTEFTDGTNLNIPTIGEMSVTARTPGSHVTLQDPTTGNYVLTGFSGYETGFAIPFEFKDDAFYTQMAVAQFVKEMAKGLMRKKESDIAHLQAQQTASNPNVIDGFDHRWVATGTSNAIALADFQKANLAFDKSFVPTGNRKAFIDPTVVYQLQQISNYVAQDVYGTNAHIAGSLSGRRAVGSVGGFTIETSNVLDSAVVETIVATAPNAGSRTSVSAYANMFVGEEAFIGAMRTTPIMKNWYDNDTQSERYWGFIRYALDLFRPESMCVVLTDVV
jgi:hypothetical protein